MAPDVEELIKRVNTLSLDKNRLKQKLTQLLNGQSNARGSLTKLSSSSFESPETAASDQTPNTTTTTSSTNTTNTTNSATSNKSSSPSGRSNLIAGIECATSCEDDILYLNELYRKRLEDYDDNWDLIQSKCSALLLELSALQKHFVLMKRENQELEEKYLSQCNENNKIKSELQTVVLNYETQLSAMSEHLSSITRQLSLEDDSTPMRSLRNPNYID